MSQGQNATKPLGLVVTGKSCESTQQQTLFQLFRKSLELISKWPS